MNFLQLAQAVKRESGLGSANSIVSVTTATGDDLRICKWVNWAARDITLAREDWRFRRAMATLPSATAMVNNAAAFGLSDFASWKDANINYKPSGYRLVDGLSQERELTFMAYDAFRKNFLIGFQTTGSPVNWSMTPDDQFLIGPAPDSAYFIRADYVKDYTDMLLDADIPIIPARFHMIIVWKALMEYGGFDAASEVTMRATENYSRSWTSMVQSQLETPSVSARSLA